MDEGESRQIPLLTSRDIAGVGIQIGVLGGEAQTPVVMLDCADRAIEAALVSLLRAAQNGRRFFGGEAPTYFGDERIEVRFTAGPSPSQVMVEVWARPPQGHLTTPFIFRGVTSRESVDIFRKVLEVAGHYALCLGRQGKPSIKELSLIKYRLTDAAGS